MGSRACDERPGPSHPGQGDEHLLLLFPEHAPALPKYNALYPLQNRMVPVLTFKDLSGGL